MTANTAGHALKSTHSLVAKASSHVAPFIPSKALVAASSTTVKPRSTRYTRYSRRTLRLSNKTGNHFFIRKNLADYERDELDNQNRCMFHQRVYILAKNNAQQASSSPSSHATDSHKLNDSEQPNYYMRSLETQLLDAFTVCDNESFTLDQLTGLFLCMGDYTLLVLESAEDTVGCVCNRLGDFADRYWLANRVFLIEDHIDECYFNTFVCRRAAAININEKFPAHTTTDVELMGQQHLTISERLRAICARIAETLDGGEQLALKSSHYIRSDRQETPLPPAEFNKLMPEVQRIELVLNCSRFYRTVQAHALLYVKMPREEDDDAHVWPIPYNYTPLGVFSHAVYDVNLTFSDYGKKEEEPKERGTEDESSEADMNQEGKAKGEGDVKGP